MEYKETVYIKTFPMVLSNSIHFAKKIHTVLNFIPNSYELNIRALNIYFISILESQLAQINSLKKLVRTLCNIHFALQIENTKVQPLAPIIFILHYATKENPFKFPIQCHPYCSSSIATVWLIHCCLRHNVCTKQK